MTKVDNLLRDKKKRIAAELLANPSFTGTNKDIFAQAGVSHETFYKWLRDPVFRAEVEKLVAQYTDGELARVWKALLRQCEKGDTQAIKLFFELKGKYKTSVDVAVQSDDGKLGAILEQLRG